MLYTIFNASKILAYYLCAKYVTIPNNSYVSIEELKKKRGAMRDKVEEEKQR